MFRKVLIANRGEIAVRIMQACADLGVASVAVFSDADRHALHVRRADEAFAIGADPLAGYLNPHHLVNLAVETGCDALHPGYGFLAENPVLAEVCAQRGVRFIGPSPEAIRRMGDKTEARRTMIAAGVPVTPGTDGNLEGADHAVAEAERIGYPVMIKATSGGGGRGIRRADAPDELRFQYDRVVSEATKAFGSARVFLEKCIVDPRHIEVQVLADGHGNTVHLFERDCSIQRRNQKLIEIAPSPALTGAQRDRLGEFAVRAARAVGYESAGTVEFLVSGEDAYFMEMNTRIQVEHTITEEVTGVDIVAEQIRVAAGEPLSFSQGDVRPMG
jgi:pyruvate carboxylase subunit A